MKLTEEPEIVLWPETYYVFVERVGPFQTHAPQAWQEAHAKVGKLAEHNTIEKYTSLYKVPTQTYRAGFALAAPPSELPEGLRYEVFPGGKYSRFLLTGSYSNLPAASMRVMKLVEEQEIAVRDDFFIENYVNDPRSTPEDELMTEILIPTV